MNPAADYQHTQKSPLSTLLIAVAIGIAGLAWFLRDLPEAVLICGAVAVVLCLAAACFHQLTVVGAETGLKVRYGPIPLFHKTIPYSSIAAVEASESSVIDGWGIHFIPGRGWTYNLWGFHCVLLQRHENSSIRIGTDDVAGLVEFLQSKVERSSNSA